MPKHKLSMCCLGIKRVARLFQLCSCGKRWRQSIRELWHSTCVCAPFLEEGSAPCILWCLHVPVNNGPSRLKALIYFLPARGAAALCPALGAKEAHSGHSSQVSCCRDAAGGENVEVPFCEPPSVSISSILFSSSSPLLFLRAVSSTQHFSVTVMYLRPNYVPGIIPLIKAELFITCVIIRWIA